MWERIREYQVPIIVAVVALVVGFGASLWWNSSRKESSSELASNEGSTLTSEATSTKDNLPPLPITRETEEASTTKPDTSATTPKVSSPSEAPAVASGTNELVVNDQAAGSTVTIAKANLVAAVWIAIHEERDGGPGNILGALWLPAGVSTDATVELRRNTQPGQTYYAMIHTDVGEDHMFDYTVDKPLKASSGEVIMTKFRTTGS